MVALLAMVSSPLEALIVMPVVPDGPEAVVPHELVPSTFILSQSFAIFFFSFLIS